MACALPSGDLYGFYFSNRTKAPEVGYAHYLQNSDPTTVSAISAAYGTSISTYIFLSTKSTPGQQYSDKIRLIHFSGVRSSSPYIVQKEISVNTIGSITAAIEYDSILLGSTRHYESESPTLNSAQLFRMDTGLDTSTYSPTGAAELDTLSSYTHSSLGPSVTNTVLADMDTLRSHVYHSSLDNVSYLDPSSAMLTDEMKLTEDGFQTIQPITFELSPSYSLGASAASTSEYLTYSVKQCQGASWEIAEAKVGGVDVPWVTTRTPNTFLIEPSLATGPGVC